MTLLKFHPEVANRECKHCQDFLYDEETGKLQLNKKFNPPQPIARPLTVLPPCRTSTGCPKGTPENNCELTEKNWLAYVHYLQCKAVGDFPKDAIVYRNAVIIRSVEDEYQRFVDTSLREWIKALASRRML